MKKMVIVIMNIAAVMTIEALAATVSPIFYSLKNARVDNERLTRTAKSCANTFSKPAQSAITAL